MLRMIQIDKSFNIGTINEKQIFQGLNLILTMPMSVVRGE